MSRSLAEPGKRRRESAGDGNLQSYPDVYGNKAARRKLDNPVIAVESATDEDMCMPSDAHAAILSLVSELPKNLDMTIPRIVFQHQVYTVVTNRTMADKQLDKLRVDKVIRIFKLGSRPDEMAIMLAKDYSAHIQGFMQNKQLAKTFLKAIDKEHSVSITKEALYATGHIQPSELPQLINNCCVTLRDPKSLWISIPNAGGFTKSLRVGRQQLKKLVKSAKFRELLEFELLKRKLKGSKLGIRFHVSDIVGAGELVRVNTTMGPLLRFPESW